MARLSWVTWRRGLIGIHEYEVMFAALFRVCLHVLGFFHWLSWAPIVFLGLLMPVVGPMMEREERASAVRAPFEAARIPVVIHRNADGITAEPTRQLDPREQLLWQHLCEVKSRGRAAVRSVELRLGGRRARTLTDQSRTTLTVTPGSYSTDARPLRLGMGLRWIFFAVGAALLLFVVRRRNPPDGTTLAERLSALLAKGGTTAAAFAAIVFVLPDDRKALLPRLYGDLQRVEGRIASAQPRELELENVTVAYDFAGPVEQELVHPVTGGRRVGDRVDLMVNRFGARFADVDYAEFEPRPYSVTGGIVAVILFTASRLVRRLHREGDPAADLDPQSICFRNRGRRAQGREAEREID